MTTNHGRVMHMEIGEASICSTDIDMMRLHVAKSLLVHMHYA
jgi:hypothetical protein